MHAVARVSERIYDTMRNKGHGKIVSGLAAATVPVAFLGTFFFALHQGINQNDQRDHIHQPNRIERTFWDYDKDGKYDEGVTKMTFKDGCVQEEAIPWYVIGRTRKEYEEIYKKIDSLDSLDDIEETLSFR